MNFPNSFQSLLKNNKMKIEHYQLMDGGYSLLLTLDGDLDPDATIVSFPKSITGKNGLPLVNWASTIATDMTVRPAPNLDFKDPWSDALPPVENVQINHRIDRKNNKLLVEVDIAPTLDIVFRGILGFFSEDDVYLDGAYPTYTENGGAYSIDIANCKPGNYQLTVLIAGEIFSKNVTIN